jgi:hypothetical protein
MPAVPLGWAVGPTSRSRSSSVATTHQRRSWRTHGLWSRCLHNWRRRPCQERMPPFGSHCLPNRQSGRKDGAGINIRPITVPGQRGSSILRLGPARFFTS